MKYSELHRLLQKAGCYQTGEQRVGHPEWYSPKTGKKQSNEMQGFNSCSLKYK